MKRDLYRRLLAWKNDPYRKPLVLKGARQVGKTWLLRDFGKREFENCIVLNCDKDERVREIFDHGFRTERILSDMKERRPVQIRQEGAMTLANAAIRYEITFGRVAMR